MKNALQQTKIIALGIIVAAGISYAFAWTGPTSTPPGGNVSSPLNVSSSTQVKFGSLVLNGLSVNAATILGGLLQIPIGTPAAGDVLTSADASGTVEWEPSSGGSGASSSPGVVFVAPTTVATISGSGSIGWTTVDVQADGIPTNATGIILGININTNNQQTCCTAIYERSSSASGNSYTLAQNMTSGGGAPTTDNYNEGVYPVNVSSSGVVSFDYSSGPNNQNSWIQVLGYTTGGGNGSGSTYVTGVTGITAGNNITISPSGGTGNVTINAVSTIPATGSVGGGCYYTSSGAGDEGAGAFKVSASCWGNATAGLGLAGSGGSCGTGYNLEYTSSVIAEGAGTVPASFMCIHS